MNRLPPRRALLGHRRFTTGFGAFDEGWPRAGVPRRARTVASSTTSAASQSRGAFAGDVAETGVHQGELRVSAGSGTAPSTVRRLQPALPGHVRRLLAFPTSTVHPYADLPALLEPGDLVVVNDAATLPASLTGQTAAGEAIEVRLAGRRADGDWETVAFGAGDWRTDTDLRPNPPSLRTGDALRFGPLVATVVAVPHARRPTLRFVATDDDFWRLLYAVGRPVQYRHLPAALDVWDVQTPFSGPPWAVEPPSAGLALTLDVLAGLRARGVDVATITEAAGLSATGDAALDAALPFAERYAVPAATWAKVQACRGRVIAVGTSVVRALETVARTGELAGWTTLKLSAANLVRVVSGLVSGVHAPGTSHLGLIEAMLAGNGLPEWSEMGEEAAALGLRDHEFGDGVLILGTPHPGQ